MPAFCRRKKVFMKKRLFTQRISVLLILLLILSFCFASCGGKADYSNGGDADYSYNEDGFASSDGETPSEKESALLENRIIIKTVHMEGETKAFDDSLAFIKSEVATLGGYIQSSDINNGDSYSGGKGVSRANMTIRIPAEKLSELLSSVGDRINVTYNKENIDDITDKYTDTEARINALKTQEARLLELLAAAENLNDIITLEEKLGAVRYEIESYTAQIRNYDTLVKYSTVYLNIREVAEYTEPEEPTFGARIAEAFKESWAGFAEGCKDFAVFVVYIIPTALVLAVIAAAVILLVRICSKRNRKAQEAKRAESEARMAAFNDKNQGDNDRQ